MVLVPFTMNPIITTNISTMISITITVTIIIIIGFFYLYCGPFLQVAVLLQGPVRFGAI